MRHPVNCRRQVIRIVTVVLTVILTSLLSLLTAQLGAAKENVLMIYLVGVLAAAVITHSCLYGAITSVCSVLAFNFFFADPVHSLLVRNGQDALLVVFFLAAALICGTVSSRLRTQTVLARRMHRLTGQLLMLTDEAEILQTGMVFISHVSGYPCRIEPNHSDPTGQAAETPGYFPHPENMRFPLRGRGSASRTLLLATGGARISRAGRTQLTNAVYQISIALDRAFIYSEREKIRLRMESERLKNTLLRSLSHDIRTPLTAISGAAGVIMDDRGNLTAEEIRSLACDIWEKADTFSRTVRNILDLTRITDQAMRLNRTPEAVDDLLHEAAQRARAALRDCHLTLHAPADILTVPVDGELVVQALVNLLTNAAQHGGAACAITLSASQTEEGVEFCCIDNGPGISPEILPVLFDGLLTHAAGRGDRARGTGLGLTICKAIAEAHGGRITAENRQPPAHGAVFRMLLPDCEKEEFYGTNRNPSASD